MTNPYQSSSQTQFDQPNQMVACRGCQKELHISAAICPSCGASQRTTRYKNKIVAALLAFFIGGFGIHRFYLGQWWGIFYILFIWTGIPSLVSLVEFIVFLASNQFNWDQRYNQGKSAAPGEGSGAGLVVGLVVGVFVFVAFIGILAAIAIPAYQDYTLRSHVTQAMLVADDVKLRYVNYVRNYQQLPTSNSDLQITQPLVTQKGHQISVDENGILIQFHHQNRSVNEGTILLIPDFETNPIRWNCTGGTLAKQYRPIKCR